MSGGDAHQATLADVGSIVIVDSLRSIPDIQEHIKNMQYQLNRQTQEILVLRETVNKLYTSLRHKGAFKEPKG